MTILAVDDEKLALASIVEQIKQLLPEAEVLGFRKPSEALEAVQEKPCEIAFLDIEMKEMDGITLAKRIKRLHPQTNIIFTTGYSAYTGEAFSLHASGYLTKPVRAEQVAQEMDNLLHPLADSHQLVIRTFGNFEVLYNGKPVEFERSKAKELLAYLVSRGGATVTRKEIAAILFENQEYDLKTQDYLSKIYRSLRTTLQSIHAEDILIKGRNLYGVDISKVSCDAADYLKGLPYAINLFQGEYMSQYSWAEGMIGRFVEISNRE